MNDIYITDTNLIFSAVLNLQSGISRFILKSKEYEVSLYAPEYLRTEIERHKTRIAEISGLSIIEIDYVLGQIYINITFISDDLIPFEEYVKAMRMVRDIDPDDVTFIALNNFLNKTLWTGDNQLYQGLKEKGYTKVVNFEDLKSLYNL